MVSSRCRYLHLEFFHHYRSLYRSQTCALDGVAGALSCPESCDDDTPDSECVCTCAGIDKSNDNANFDWKNLETCMYCEFLKLSTSQLNQICNLNLFWGVSCGHEQERLSRRFLGGVPQGYHHHVLLHGSQRGRDA